MNEESIDGEIGKVVRDLTLRVSIIFEMVIRHVSEHKRERDYYSCLKIIIEIKAKDIFGNKQYTHLFEVATK
jgi:hypothetical protein